MAVATVRDQELNQRAHAVDIGMINDKAPIARAAHQS